MYITMKGAHTKGANIAERASDRVFGLQKGAQANLPCALMDGRVRDHPGGLPGNCSDSRLESNR